MLFYTRSSAVAERARVLRVTEYFAKSLEVIRNDTLEQGEVPINVPL